MNANIPTRFRDYSKSLPTNRRQECSVWTNSSSASLSLTSPPNHQTKNPAFQARSRSRTHKIHESHCDEGFREIGSKKEFSLPPNVKTITSTSNSFVKHCVKLRQSSSYRHLHGLVLVVRWLHFLAIRKFSSEMVLVFIKIGNEILCFKVCRFFASLYSIPMKHFTNCIYPIHMQTITTHACAYLQSLL